MRSKIRRRSQSRKGFSELLASRDGSALLAVLCVMLAISALSLSLLLRASTLSALARKTSAREQCRIMAESVGLMLDEELEEKLYSDIPSGNPEGDGLWDYVGAYVCEKDSDWVDYDPRNTPGQARRVFHLEGKDWPKDAGEVTVAIYWVKEEEGGQGQKESWSDYFHRIDIDLYVEITCSCQRESCTITNVYAKVSNPSDHSWKWFRRAGGE